MDKNFQAESSLAARLAASCLAVSKCFQCRKCSGGCPLTFAMDLLPDRVIRLVFLVLLFTQGFGFLIYLILWLLLPVEGGTETGGGSVGSPARSKVSWYE